MDEVGCETWNTYDRLGRLKVISQKVEDNGEIFVEKREYDAFSRVIQCINAINQSITYAYDDKTHATIFTYPIQSMQTIIKQNIFGEKIETIDGMGAKEVFIHDADGQIQEHQDGLGNSIKYFYNNIGQKIKTIDSSNMVSEYKYNDAKQLVEKIEDTEGLQLVTKYFPNMMGKNEKIIDPRGVITLQEFDRLGQLKKSIKDPGELGLNIQTQYQYNFQGLQTHLIQGDDIDENQMHKQKFYDGFNCLIFSIKDPEQLNIKTTFFYNKSGLITKKINPNGFIQRNYYDLRGRKRFEIQMMDNETLSANEWQYTDTNKIQNKRTYLTKFSSEIISDETCLNQLSEILNIDENDTLDYFYYDTNDEERFHLSMVYSATENSLQGIIEEKRYDLAGRLIAHIKYERSLSIGDSSTLTTQILEKLVIEIRDFSKDQAVYMWHDAAGRPLFFIDQNGCITQQLYDVMGRLIRKIQYKNTIDNPESLLNVNVYELAACVVRSKSDQISSFIYDNCGYEIFSVNSNNAVTRKDYDENHNLISTCLFKNTIILPEGYDQLCEDLKSWHPDADKDSITQNTFNAINQHISTIDALGNQEYYQVDAIGNVKTIINRRKKITEYQYDRAKRCIKELYNESTYAKVIRDEEGKLKYNLMVCSPKKTIEYDKCGNQTMIMINGDADEKRIINQAYNAQNQLIKTILPDIPINDEKLNYDESWQGLQTLPLIKKNLCKTIIYDTKGNIISQKDENDQWAYFVYDSRNNLIFSIDREKSVAQYTYNNFNQIISEYRYANAFEIDCEPYRVNGLKERFILDNLKFDAKDRFSKFQYNQRGDMVHRESAPLFYYSRDDYGFEKPVLNKTYDTFGRSILESKYIRPNVWAEKRTWYDSIGNILAEINENNYITRFSYNSADKPLEKYEYSEQFLLAPDPQIDIEILDQMIVKSEKDRIYQYSYDLLGQLKTETQLDVVTNYLTFDEKNIPDIGKNLKKDLTREWLYNATEKLIVFKHEDGGEEKYSYDISDNKIAEWDVMRKSKNEKGEIIELFPQKKFHYNIFGELAVMNTMLDDSISLIEEITLYDNRGLPQLKQDAEKNLSGFTYTPSEKIARQLQVASNWENVCNDMKIIKRENFIDEKLFFYNHNHQPLSMHLIRNGISEESTYHYYDAFGDLIGEGPSSNQIPSFSFYDPSGYQWFTNRENGVNTIILRDLQGMETLRLQAPQDDLSKISYDNLSDLMIWDTTRVDRSETIHDEGGRVIAHKVPIWFKDRDAEPSRSYRHDRWNNIVRETNSLGHVIDFLFNSQDKISEHIQPEVDIYLEDMSTMRVRPKTTYGYNERGLEIGIKDGNNHVTGYVLDEAGNCVMLVLADGTVSETIYDVLNRTTALIDARGKITRYKYNAKNQILAQRTPSDKTIQYEYDESNNRISQTDGEGNILRYSYDAKNNIIERYLPLGQCTTMIYDRNHVKTGEFNSDDSKLTWETDYFGNLIKHKDLGGKIINYTYDNNKHLIHKFSQNELARQMLVMNAPIIQLGWVVHNYQYIPVAAEDIYYSYHYGLLDTIQDNSLNKTVLYTYNTERKRVSLQNNKSQILINKISTYYDALEREISNTEQQLSAAGYYSYVTSNKAYDAVGNIRLNYINLDPTCHNAYLQCRAPQRSAAVYHSYDVADRIHVLSGNFINGKIQVSNMGTEFEYKNGFRTQEKTLNGITLFDYDDDGRLISSEANNGMKTLRLYDSAGWIQSYQEIYGGHQTERKIHFNENGWQTTDDFFDNGSEQSSSLYADFTLQGLPKKQTINDYKNSTTDNYEISYLPLDRWVQNSVSGIRNGSQSLGVASFWYDSHNIISGKSYLTQDEPEFQKNSNYPNKFPLYFETTADGLILNKEYITQGTGKNNIYEYDYFYHYHHNVYGELCGAYSFNFDSVLAANHPYPNTSQHNCGFYYPKFEGPYPYTLPQSLSVFNLEDRTKKMNPLWNVDARDVIPIAPQTYIVDRGDTFESIAKKMFGDDRYANKIASFNGMIDCHSPKPGFLLYLPQIINERYRSDTVTSRPYYLFLDYIMGSLLPRLPGVQAVNQHHRHHNGFLKNIIKIIAVGIIMAIAPPLGNIVLGLAGIAITPMSSTIAALVTGALLDASVQGLAIETGVQSNFSFAEVLETSSNIGVDRGFNTTDLLLNAAKKAFHMGTVQVTNQLTEMAAGIRTKFDARAISLQVSTMLADHIKNSPAKSNTQDNFLPMVARSFKNYPQSLVDTRIVSSLSLPGNRTFPVHLKSSNQSIWLDKPNSSNRQKWINQITSVSSVSQLKTRSIFFKPSQAKNDGESSDDGSKVRLYTTMSAK